MRNRIEVLVRVDVLVGAEVVEAPDKIPFGH